MTQVSTELKTEPKKKSKKPRGVGHMIWVDMEMSGLEPAKHRILEMAIVITDAQLNVVTEPKIWVVKQPKAHLDKMDAWNRATHKRSGLVERVLTVGQTLTQVEIEAIAFLRQHTEKGMIPMCGNTIGQDRRFMQKYMPRLEAWFHYRNIDVSTLKELAKRWHPEIQKGFTKKNAHTALADVIESIEELRYYRQHWIVGQTDAAQINETSL
jgi:oligoribonuclease